MNYGEYCGYRLPCGICTRTNQICPLSCGTIKIGDYITATETGVSYDYKTTRTNLAKKD